ncbi:MAG: hypothetical protein II975_09000 [Bacteroidales bacterium]|nr:hypothetical protein [Bacteroidales bacterium]MBQ6742132.1 hypothetical protein [Bacteroidales bacterium]
MKTKAIFESCIGALGILLWVLLLNADCSKKDFWIALPAIIAGICVPFLWSRRHDFAVPESFKPIFKKVNIISLIGLLFMALIVILSVGTDNLSEKWDICVWFVAYGFVLCHGMLLYSFYSNYKRKEK